MSLLARRGIASCAIALGLAACGTDVDLGGAVDAGVGTIDAGCLSNDAKCSSTDSGGPVALDGAPIEHCGDLDAPSTPSQCKACDPDAGDCQPNGCYGGYWCNAQKTDCETPPTSCP